MADDSSSDGSEILFGLPAATMSYGDLCPIAATNTTLRCNATIWQWSDEAGRGPQALLAAADHGAAHLDPARWMLIDDDSGRILDVDTGSGEEQPTADRQVNMGGRLILPGLQDSHIHCYMLGASSVQVDLAGCESISAMTQRVARHAATHPELSWVIGIGWE